jgi:hypothetical protein
MNRYLSAILCASLIAAAATLFIEQRRILSIRRQFASEAVQADWKAARFVIRPANNSIDWFYDPNDPMEADEVQRLRQIYLLADSQGHILQYSSHYKELGLPFSPEKSASRRVWESKGASQSSRYLLCTGPISGPHGDLYHLTVGRQLDPQTSTEVQVR